MLYHKKNGFIKTDNHGALRKIIADYFMISKYIDHICQCSGIEMRVVLVVKVFRFFHTLLTYLEFIVTMIELIVRSTIYLR